MSENIEACIKRAKNFIKNGSEFHDLAEGFYIRKGMERSSLEYQRAMYQQLLALYNQNEAIIELLKIKK